MKGILFAVFAGIFITLQGTFNAKLSSHIGIWSTSIITHLIGLIICAETMSIYSLGVTLTAGTLMVAQLLTATVIEMKGLFHIKKIQMERYHIVGTIVMIIGIVVFNM
ncbi:DMT family transporter [Bacillus cereus group sp. MYBK249-1]|uniref:DMT family transporter n=1 Tax=Bacillus TaxID=1386 RepID=UPI002A334FD4|nr:DMT family transporter [Bacillus cereus]HDR4462076.1 DMT family transporter [Bacillus cereus]HDR4465454.1 DMT family transporter [Bacillus cereus]HDR6755750.1 DMT family transporter [Bacillus cereus]